MIKSNLFKKFTELGYHPNDTDNEKLQKSTLLVMAIPFAAAGLLWGILYFVNGLWYSGLIPFSYSILSILSIVNFGVTKKYSFFRASQLLLILILPFALQISLGGFIPASGVIMWAIISPLGALVFLGKEQSVKWFIAFIALVVIAYLVNSKLPEYFDWNIASGFIDVLFLMNIIGISILIFGIQYYFVSKRTLLMKLLEDKHQWIKEAFSSYISPNLVEHIVKNPDELKLGGERRECSFVFTDLVGFTSLVEQSDPTTIVSALNQYFEGMTQIVFKHEGTVSKIVGDALAIMFSAPIEQQDHANKAVNCALEMDAYAKEFHKQNLENGLDLGRTRIGVNTGVVIVGNVGSKNHLDYRALGDAINTAARLESVNKQIGTNVCVSETTVNKCDDFIGRPIGSLLLKGKTQTVDTFEPLNEDFFNSNQNKAYLEAFKLMKSQSEDALAAFRNYIDQYPEDRLAYFHLKRLSSGKNGVTIVLDSK